MQKHNKANNSTDRTIIWSPDLFCIHDRPHSNSQSHGGHFWEISIEEASVGHDSVLCESLHPGSGHQARTRLIKGNVAIWSNTWHTTLRFFSFIYSFFLTAQSLILLITVLSALCSSDLRQTAESLPQLLSSPQRRRTLLEGQRRCHRGCGCSLLVCRCAWRSYSTWRSGSSQGGFWGALKNKSKAFRCLSLRINFICRSNDR